MTEKATGSAVTKSITPGQMVVKIVHDELIRVLAGDDTPEALKIDNPPATVLMVGLQGSGKTTTSANAILLQYTAPVWVALLGAWLLRERATRAVQGDRAPGEKPAP